MGYQWTQHTHTWQPQGVSTYHILRQLYFWKVTAFKIKALSVGWILLHKRHREDSRRISSSPLPRSGGDSEPRTRMKYVHVTQPLWRYRACQSDDPNSTYIFNKLCDERLQMAVCLARAYIPLPLTRKMHALLSCAMRVGAVCWYPRSSIIRHRYTQSSAHCDTL